MYRKKLKTIALDIFFSDVVSCRKNMIHNIIKFMDALSIPKEEQARYKAML